MRPNSRQIIPPKEKRRPPKSREESKFDPDAKEEKLLTDQPQLGNRSEWTKEEFRCLISEYGLVSGWHNKTRTEAADALSLIKFVWRKQNGLCAVSDLPLLGPPGCLGSGVGIDLLERRFGFRKGNVRLVSCPFAITRLEWHEPIINILNDEHYQNLPISFAIFKHLQWAFEDCKDLKHLPIDIRFLEPDWVRERGYPHGRVSYSDAKRVCEVRLHLKHPARPTVSGYQRSELVKTTVQKIHIQDDTLTYDQTHHCVASGGGLVRRPYEHGYHSNLSYNKITIKLHDPDDFIPRIVETTVTNTFLHIRKELQGITNEWQ